MSEPTEDLKLSDEESVLFLKLVRHDVHNIVRRLVIKECTVEILFVDETQEPAVLQKEEAMSWKDKEWQEFFQKHEPLL
jgi:hypothetical protein